MTDRPDPAAESWPLAPFRPRRARLVAIVMGVAAVLVFAVVGLFLQVDAMVVDRLGILLIGVAVGLVCWRYASVAAVPDRSGILVRNLLVSRRVEWAQVARVEFGGGTPWASLELADGELVAVMAIQRADGIRADMDASRLAGLVEALRER